MRRRHSSAPLGAAVLLLLSATSACDSDSGTALDATLEAAPVGLEVPSGETLPPLAYTLTPSYGHPPSLPRPETIRGHLFLRIDGDGAVTGTISAADGGPVGLVPIAGHVDGAEIVLAADAIPVAPGGSLGLDELRLVLLDQDGDGAVDGAEGEGAGSWQRALGDRFDQTTHASTFTAGLDGTSTRPIQFVERSALVLLPYEPVRVRFEEPLRKAAVRRRLRVRADGQIVPARQTAVAVDGLVVEAELQPDVYLPFGAEVTVDVAGLRDPSGNLLLPAGEGIPVAADPGALGANTGFEAGLDGWVAVGQVGVEGGFQGVAPVEGAAQGVVREQSTLTAAIDVPDDATELELSVAVLTEGWEVDADHTAVITLRGPAGEATEIFDVADVADQLEDCAACTDYGAVVGPLRRAIDLAPHRGRRVFLAVDVRSSFFFGVNFFAAVVDDLRLGRSGQGPTRKRIQ